VLYQYDQAAADDLKKRQARINAKRAEKPVEDFVSVLSEEPGPAPATHVFHRGDYRQPTQAVKPGDLTIAAPEGERLEIADRDAKLPTSGRRLAWARHLVSGTHPLAGRVLANRIWLHHFGRGLVDSPGDLGTLGTRPTHPELLDWLAAELPRQGWSLKRMHKLIMTSTAYRQSSRREPARQAVDADNALVGRNSVRRLEAEALRDRILSASGLLDRSLFGPPVPIEEDAVGQVGVKGDRPRRSVYLQVRRTKPVSFLAAFDAPLMAVNCERRLSSTVAPQSLMLMNGDFILKHAQQFAQRLRTETPADYARDLAGALAAKYPRPSAPGPSLAQQVAYAWQIAYQRPASPEEVDLACQFVVRQTARLRAAAAPGDPELAALTNLCQQLLSSNEFLYVD
jgi:hypothetical protein